MRYSFGVQVHKGKMENPMKQTPLAKEFVAMLLEDSTTRQLLKEQNIEFNVNANFQLMIKNTTARDTKKEEQSSKMDGAEQPDPSE